MESGVRVTCDVGYLCANFGLPRPLCSRLGPMYVTDVRQKHRLMFPPISCGGIISKSRDYKVKWDIIIDSMLILLVRVRRCLSKLQLVKVGSFSWDMQYWFRQLQQLDGLWSMLYLNSKVCYEILSLLLMTFVDNTADMLPWDKSDPCSDRPQKDRPLMIA